MKWSLIPKFRPRARAQRTSYALLQEVIAAIREEPNRINMDLWLSDEATEESEPKVAFPVCGTQGCIAGWMVSLTAPSKRHLRSIATGWSEQLAAVAGRLMPPDVPTNLLFLDESVRDPDNGHFVVDRPYPFPMQSDGTPKDQRRYARAVIANIRKFMRVHKKALQAHVIDKKEVFGAR